MFWQRDRPKTRAIRFTESCLLFYFPPGLCVRCDGAAEEAGGPGGHDSGSERALRRTAEEENTGGLV